MQSGSVDCSLTSSPSRNARNSRRPKQLGRYALRLEAPRPEGSPGRECRSPLGLGRLCLFMHAGAWRASAKRGRGDCTAANSPLRAGRPDNAAVAKNEIWPRPAGLRRARCPESSIWGHLAATAGFTCLPHRPALGSALVPGCQHSDIRRPSGGVHRQGIASSPACRPEDGPAPSPPSPRRPDCSGTLSSPRSASSRRTISHDRSRPGSPIPACLMKGAPAKGWARHRSRSIAFDGPLVTNRAASHAVPGEGKSARPDNPLQATRKARRAHAKAAIHDLLTTSSEIGTVRR